MAAAMGIEFSDVEPDIVGQIFYCATPLRRGDGRPAGPQARVGEPQGPPGPRLGRRRARGEDTGPRSSRIGSFRRCSSHGTSLGT
jgi:hypothetical protein